MKQLHVDDRPEESRYTRPRSRSHPRCMCSTISPANTVCCETQPRSRFGRSAKNISCPCRSAGPRKAPVSTEVSKIALPTRYGHDLSPVYSDTDCLWVTTVSKVYQFVKSTQTWTETYAGAGDINRHDVKGNGNQPSGMIRYLSLVKLPDELYALGIRIFW